jgi:hypothetical protein
LERFDAADLSREWVLHTKISPLPDPWRQAALIASLIVNFRANRSSDSKWFSDEDFLPVDVVPEEPALLTQPPDDQIQLVTLVHQALGANDG